MGAAADVRPIVNPISVLMDVLWPCVRPRLSLLCYAEPQDDAMSTVQPRAVPNQERTDCTASCRLRDHACKCLASVALGDIKLLHKFDSICGNPYCIKDEYGRNSLHVAASLGHSDIATRLVKEKCVNVNEPDGESSWTGLHRSAYFGHLETAVELTKVRMYVVAVGKITAGHQSFSVQYL